MVTAPAAQATSGSPGSMALQVLDIGGEIEHSMAFGGAFQKMADPPIEVDSVPFGFVLPYPRDAAAVRLVRDTRDFATPLDPQDQEPTIIDLLQTNGPLDQSGPTVGFTAPSPGTPVAVGSSVTATVTATDDVSVDTVTLDLDVDGDGVISEPDELVEATPLGGNVYQGTFCCAKRPGRYATDIGPRNRSFWQR
jgi:hypothetical protein